MFGRAEVVGGIPVEALAKLDRSPANLIATKNTIKLLRAALRSNPDISWDEFEATYQVSPLIADNGGLLVRRAFDRYQGARKATVYWDNQWKQDQEATESHIRTAFDIPQNGSTRFSFLEDCCVITMPNDALNEYRIITSQKMGADSSKYNGLEVEGFTADYFYLTDPQGNRCNIIFVNSDTQEVEHEHEHAIFSRYFTPSEPMAYQQHEDLREAFGGHVSELMEELEGKSIPLGEMKTVAILFALLESGFSGSFRNELHAYGMNNKVDKYTLLHVAELFNPIGFHTQGNGFIMRVMMDMLLEQTRSEFGQDSLQTHTAEAIMEFLAINFVRKNRVIAGWANSLWEKVGGDKEEFISTLYAIPLHRMWKIGYFIDQDPNELKRQLLGTPADDAEVEASGITALFSRRIHEQLGGNLTDAAKQLQENARAVITRLSQLGITQQAAGLRDFYVHTYIPTYMQHIHDAYEIADRFYRLLKQEGFDQSMVPVKKEYIKQAVQSVTNDYLHRFHFFPLFAEISGGDAEMFQQLNESDFYAWLGKFGSKKKGASALLNEAEERFWRHHNLGEQKSRWSGLRRLAFWNRGQL
ncbi:MAG: hypothetical protein KGL95_07930 [Patescibacteria group bacterium]|nr:hypothetical protein [Patescibacteria group bacterium]